MSPQAGRRRSSEATPPLPLSFSRFLCLSLSLSLSIFLLLLFCFSVVLFFFLSFFLLPKHQRILVFPFMGTQTSKTRAQLPASR